MRRLKTVRRPPIYPKTPGHLPYSLTHPLPLSSRRPSVSFGGFGLNGTIVNGRENTFSQIAGVTPEYLSVRNLEVASGQFLSNQHVESRAEVAVLGSSVG